MAFAAATLFVPPPVTVRSPARIHRRPSIPSLLHGVPTNGAAGRRQIKRSVIANASPGNGGVRAGEGDGVSLGTMKLPGNIDIARFETLLFQVNSKTCKKAGIAQLVRACGC